MLHILTAASPTMFLFRLRSIWGSACTEGVSFAVGAGAGLVGLESHCVPADMFSDVMRACNASAIEVWEP